ncbi:hypothetical protein D9M71_279060 [compost metagenome]
MQVGVHGLFHIRRLGALDDVGAHFEGQFAVAALEDRFLHHRLEAAHLLQGDGDAGGVGDGQALDAAEVFPLGVLRAHHHRHGAGPFAHLGDRVAGEQGVELALHFIGGEAEQAQAVLVEHQSIGAGAFAPVDETVAGHGVGGHHLAHLFADLPQLFQVRAGDAEHHREGHRRAEYQLGDAHPCRGEFAGGDACLHALAQGVAGLGVGGLHDDLGEGRVRQFGVQGEEEARRAAAHVGVHQSGLGLFQQGLLHQGDHAFRGLEGTARRHVDLHQQLGTVGVGEELLLHRAQAEPAGDEGRHHQGGDRLAMVHAPVDEGAQALVEAGGVERFMAARHWLDLRQHLHPQVGREEHRHQPGGEQGEADDPEDVAGVLPGA